MSLPLHLRPALELGRLLRQRKISARELLDVCASQMARHNPALNAIICSDLDRAKKAATASDRRFKKGTPLSPFDGVPMTIKESFDWAGTPSTWGAPRFRDNIAGSKLAIVDAAHIANVEAPEVYTRTVLDFLESK